MGNSNGGKKLGNLRVCGKGWEGWVSWCPGDWREGQGYGLTYLLDCHDQGTAPAVYPRPRSLSDPHQDPTSL